MQCSLHHTFDDFKCSFLSHLVLLNLASDTDELVLHSTLYIYIINIGNQTDMNIQTLYYDRRVNCCTVVNCCLLYNKTVKLIWQTVVKRWKQFLCVNVDCYCFRLIQDWLRSLCDEGKNWMKGWMVSAGYYCVGETIQLWPDIVTSYSSPCSVNQAHLHKLWRQCAPALVEQSSAHCDHLLVDPALIAVFICPASMIPTLLWIIQTFLFRQVVQSAVQAKLSQCLKYNFINDLLPLPSLVHYVVETGGKGMKVAAESIS